MKLRRNKKKQSEYLTKQAVSSKVENVKANIKRGLKEMQQFKLGKLKGTFAKDFLNEL
ncbi:hypothetical protein [Pinibacter aurantiacus]|uniref:Uncharacterized protein n=1 Tax=Pinibacter aurantiacus TaxID=2851599 RepID=A0A9E2S7N6_9BACT|nr:hypothetical protein [Pinibacter aurantiacus]MBV4357117.1 hypothetical protein [Pinibacter aurantiacus]